MEPAAALRQGKVQTLCCLGLNPAYTTRRASLGFGDALARADFSLHLGEYVDETALRCGWHLPESHYLESWGDGRGFDGSLVIQQPLIELPVTPGAIWRR